MYIRRLVIQCQFSCCYKTPVQFVLLLIHMGLFLFTFHEVSMYMTNMMDGSMSSNLESAQHPLLGVWWFDSTWVLFICFTLSSVVVVQVEVRMLTLYMLAF